ncbi:MAG: acetyl-CoA carboxylase biotin carboxylase subunit, partial [Bacteroidota bacterium]
MQSILIANRGEIALRIIKTCRKLGIQSIAVYSDADRSAPYVKAADIALHIGASDPSSSYLQQDKIIAAAKQSRAEGIHPGYGFLSENASFARRCQQENLIFIGPNPDAIEAMGDKAKAKALMQAHKVPVVPGYQGEDQSEARIKTEAIKMGFPVLLKATAGGGGKGMRIVHQESELTAAISAAKGEAMNAFGDDRLIVEKYIQSGRHIEFQIFGDQQGKVIHLLERECSIQRRYQKVIEESPSPIMDEALRERMGQAAVQAAQALNYDNAGTVEFIYDQQSGDFYFLEVNTRLQVEHPVTEAITGLDLVELQIQSAMGEPLALAQADVVSKGYAVECRLYAEDTAHDFLPVTGKLLRFEWPVVEGLRVDSAVESGSEISVYYDPMIAKLIVWGQNRKAAHRKMRYVLNHLLCLGTTTNQAFLIALFAHPDFQAGKYDTHFLAEHPDLARSAERSSHEQALFGIAATLQAWSKRQANRSLLRSIPSGWRNNYSVPQQSVFTFGEAELPMNYRHQDGAFVFEDAGRVNLLDANAQAISFELNGVRHAFALAQNDKEIFLHSGTLGSLALSQKDRFPQLLAQKEAGNYQAPMPSQIVKVLVTTGQEVVAGDPLLVLSSMKMENTLTAAEAGVVEEIFAVEGSNVESGFV